jgi:hypothetical protein
MDSRELFQKNIFLFSLQFLHKEVINWRVADDNGWRIKERPVVSSVSFPGIRKI